MERLQLLSDLVDLDNRIIKVTAQAIVASSNARFELLIGEVRVLREKRAEIQGQLDWLKAAESSAVPAT